LEIGIIVVIGVIGVVVVNLLNKNKPVFRVGGTVVITLGCVLSLLFYYNISNFKSMQAIIVTTALSVALLVLAYFFVVLLCNYLMTKDKKRREEGKVSDRYKKKEPKKKNEKRGTAASGEAVQIRKRVQIEEASRGEEEEEERLFRKPGRKMREEDEADVTPAIEDHAADAAAEAYPAKASRRRVREVEELAPAAEARPDEADDVEEWQPDTVSSEEWQQYLQSEYAWMDEQDAESEVELSVVLGGGAEMEDEAADEDALSAGYYEQERAAEEPAVAGKAEVPAAAAIEDADEESLWELVPEQEGEEYEQFEMPVLETFGLTIEKKDAPASALEEMIDEYADEPAAEPEDAELEPGEAVTGEEYVREAAAEPEEKLKEERSVAIQEHEAEEQEEYTERAEALDMPEEYAYEEEVILEEEVVYDEPVYEEESAVYEEGQVETFDDDQPEEESEPVFDPAAQKLAKIDELKKLVAGKRYELALKKVFEILNKGYVMTPDEKQQMKIVMMTLKDKT
jgi:hypothetical protein